MFFKSFYKAPAGKPVNCSLLVKMLTSSFINKADRGKKFYVNLNPLFGMIHLLIGFGDIFGIWRFHSHRSLPAQEAVESWNRAGICCMRRVRMWL